MCQECEAILWQACLLWPPQDRYNITASIACFTEEITNPGCGTSVEWTEDLDGTYLGALLTLLYRCFSDKVSGLSVIGRVTIGSRTAWGPIEGSLHRHHPQTVEGAGLTEGWEEV